jgi:hypothetical protein
VHRSNGAFATSNNLGRKGGEVRRGVVLVDVWSIAMDRRALGIRFLDGLAGPTCLVGPPRGYVFSRRRDVRQAYRQGGR